MAPDAKYRHFARVNPRHTKADRFYIEDLVLEKQQSREASQDQRETSPYLSIEEDSIQYFESFHP